MTALHEAIREWNDAQIEWLLDQEIEMDTPDEEGNTPLMLAIKGGLYGEYVQKLLDRGADLHAVNREGLTPLQVALDYHQEYLPLLLERYTQLGEAPAVDPAYDHGRLALLFAGYTEDIVSIEALLDQGADINRGDRQEKTPLMLAAEWGKTDALRILLSRGAKVTLKDKYGETALLYAVDRHEACVPLLLEAGADPNAPTEEGFTPLMQTARSDEEGRIARLLLEYGADLNASDTEGRKASIDGLLAGK